MSNDWTPATPFIPSVEAVDKGHENPCSMCGVLDESTQEITVRASKRAPSSGYRYWASLFMCAACRDLFTSTISSKQAAPDLQRRVQLQREAAQLKVHVRELLEQVARLNARITNQELWLRMSYRGNDPEVGAIIVENGQLKAKVAELAEQVASAVRQGFTI